MKQTALSGRNGSSKAYHVGSFVKNTQADREEVERLRMAECAKGRLFTTKHARDLLARRRFIASLEVE